MLRDEFPRKQRQSPQPIGRISKKATPEMLAILRKYQVVQQEQESPDKPVSTFALAREVIRRMTERHAAEQVQPDDEKKGWYLP